MALSLAQEKTGSVTSSTPSVTMDSAITEGNLLVAVIGIDGLGALTLPSGFTLIQKFEGSYVTGAMAYKIAGSSESTTIQWACISSEDTAMWVGEYSGNDATPLDQSVENDSGSSSVTSHSTGTTGTTAQADELAVAMLVIQSQSNWDGTQSVTNGFSLIHDRITSAGSFPALFIATKALSGTGTVETTFSTTDTYGDQAYAIVATFKASAVSTNMKVNIGDVFKDVESMQINIGDTWKDVAEIKINIGDTWKTVF